MKTTSTDFKTLAENPYGARYHPKITVNGVEITDDINDFNYTGMCNAGDKFSIGNTCSAMVTFYIDNPSVNLSGKEIEVFQGINVNGTMEYVKLGKFKVLKPNDIRGRVSYQCVDRMTYLMDMPYFSELSVPTTDIEILQEICSQVSISLANTNLTSHTMNTIPSGYTRREVISYIAQFQGKNAIINDDGNLELIWYKESGYTVDDNKIYFDGTADINDETDYTLGYIECTVRSSDGSSETTLTSGSGTTGIRISNPFMTQAILDEVFSVIGGFSFRSCTFEFLGDFRLEVGDIVTVNTNGQTYKVPIMQLDQSSDGGVVTTITSVAETDSENELDITGPFTIAMDRYYAELVLINQAMINKLTVEQADIRYLQTDKLDAIEADIENAVINIVSVNYATIKQLNALTLVVSGKLEASELNAKVAELGYVTADTVSAKYATIENLNALDLTVQGKLSASEADLKYADITLGNIDTANINVANIGLLFAKVGLIDRATIVDGHVTGYLDAVEINANSITAGTLIADRILLKGSENGLLYALNNLGEVTSTAVDTLDGNIITQRTVTADKLVAKSITADELDVTNIFGNSAVLTTLTSQAAFINAISTNSIVVGASNIATEALETANTANTNASSAIDTANSANSTASSALSTANTASSNASSALSTANTANNKATYHYGTCGTAAATVAKVVTLSGFTLYTGATVTVYFTYANTASNPTLNVNGTGAKNIRVKNANITKPYYWGATDTVTFTYNGSYWVMSDTSANAIIASWCYNSDTTYINGGTIAAKTITAREIATDAIKSTNYVANTSGSFLNLADGSFDSKYLKWNNSGKLTATSGKLAQFTFDDMTMTCEVDGDVENAYIKYDCDYSDSYNYGRSTLLTQRGLTIDYSVDYSPAGEEDVYPVAHDNYNSKVILNCDGLKWENTYYEGTTKTGYREASIKFNPNVTFGYETALELNATNVYCGKLIASNVTTKSGADLDEINSNLNNRAYSKTIAKNIPQDTIKTVTVENLNNFKYILARIVTSGGAVPIMIPTELALYDKLEYASSFHSTSGNLISISIKALSNTQLQVWGNCTGYSFTKIEVFGVY